MGRSILISHLVAPFNRGVVKYTMPRPLDGTGTRGAERSSPQVCLANCNLGMAFSLDFEVCKGMPRSSLACRWFK